MFKLFFDNLYRIHSIPFLAISLLPLALTACAVDEEDTSALRVRSIATVLGLSGDPTTDRDLPAISEPKAQLGKKLFFTRGLSGDEDTACASCHHPALAGGDGLSLSIGVGADDINTVGPGRTHPSGGPTIPRNAPSTFNTGLRDRTLFLDGRVESLGKTVNLNGNDGAGIITPDSADNLTADPNAGDNLPGAQARFPVTVTEFMRGFTNFAALTTNDEIRTAIETRLAGDPEWQAEFNTVYGDTTVTYARIAEAIGEYERSQVFINSPWKTFMEGDDNAISAAARRGAMLFMLPTRVEGASCISCHRGDIFSDELFYVLAMPQIGPGAGDGSTATDDFGRFRVSAGDIDMYAFRTPSLLNVTETGPWGHTGAYTTLEGVIRHHLDPQSAFNAYDISQLETSIVNSGQTADMQVNTQNALDKLAANRAAGIFSAPLLSLTNEEISDLVEFLKTLTDPRITDRAFMAQWIADCSAADPDGLCLNAVDGSGNPL